MSLNRAPRRTRVQVAACRVAFFVLISALFGGICYAQASFSGTTPVGAAPGSPAGAYPLSNLDTINLFNGKLNFRLPLVGISGRGDARAQVFLPFSIDSWVVREDVDQNGNQQYFAEPGFSPGDAGYGLGSLYARHAGDGATYCALGWNSLNWSLTRLTFVTPDGTEYELRDATTGGRPQQVTNCSVNGYNRGKVFVTADGAAATFISDEDIIDEVYAGNALPYSHPSGYLFLKDGTRYRIEDGSVVSMRDRNGNKITATSILVNGVRELHIKDSLDRLVIVRFEGVTPQCSALDPGAVGCDKITYKGFGGAARTIYVSRKRLESLLRPARAGSAGYTLKSYGELFPELTDPNGTFNPTIVSGVWLPDGRGYRLYYNSHGELARVDLPTGGSFEYDWSAGLQGGHASGVWNGGGTSGYVIYRRVEARRVYKEGDALESRQAISKPEDSSFNNLGYVDQDQYDGSGTLLFKERHYFYGSAYSSFTISPVSYARWTDGREYKTEILDQSENVLWVTQQTWQQRAAVSWWGISPYGSWGMVYGQPTADNAPPNDPRVVETLTLLTDTGQITKQTYSYDQYNNQTDVFEYDFGGGGTAGPLLRRTHTDFVTAANYVNANADPAQGAHLRSLPSQRWVSSDVNGTNKVSLTTFEYDNYTWDSRHAPLVARVGVSGHDSTFGTSFTVRGNLTSSTSYADAAAQTGAVTVSTQYDAVGNVVKSIDTRGKESTITYSDSFCNGTTCGGSYTPNAFAFPSSTTSPVPDPSDVYGSAAALVTSTIYDFSTGAVTSSTDANGNTTTFEYNDLLDRLTRVNRPDTGYTTYEYGHAGCGDFLRTRVKLNAAGMLSDAYQCFDGLGRVYRSVGFDPQDASLPWVTVDTEYDALGRAWRVSQPYRSEGAESDVNPSERWTETLYDALGRVKTVTTLPDEAKVTTVYSGNQMTVTDQDGKSRRRVTDALGRLTQVVEDPAGLAYVTTYQYDALGNLRKVDQGGQQRFFMYDALGRLRRAKHPEQSANASLALADPATGNSQWSLAYGYDAAGNLTSRTDARGVTTAYGYDALGRNTTIDYSDTTTVNPDVKRSYDKVSGGRGMLSKSEEAGPAGTLTTVVEYDLMGRPTSQDQQFKTATGWGTAFNTRREYDLAGNVTSQTYPSGRKVDYTYDAAGRLLSFAGRLGDGVLRTYADQMRYDDGGRAEQERFGTATPVYNKSFYNVRGQLAEIRVSTYGITHATQGKNRNRGAIINHYSLQSLLNSGTDNNGNLRRQDVLIPSDDATTTTSQTTQVYEYDALNRLDAASEVSGGVTRLRQDYAYDRWGNRTLSAVGTWLGQPAAAPSELVNEKQFDGSELASTNRLYAPGDAPLPMGQRRMQYDAAGNLVKDTYTGAGARTYDAEGRMISAQDSLGQAAHYTYDADGRRVRRKVGTAELWQVYGFDGELLAEYAAGASVIYPKKEYGYRAGALLVTAELTGAPAESNLALGKEAWQSSTLSHASDPVASKAVDGNTDGNFFSQSMAHTNSEARAWWRVDLGAVRQINTIKVWNRTDCCAERLTDFYVFVSDVPFQSDDLNATISQAGVWYDRTEGQGGRPTSLTVGRTGRYVRVQLAGTNYLGLAEVEVLGTTASTPEPVAWTSAVGVTASGSTLTKSSTGALAWDAGATSTKAIVSGDGYVEFTAAETNKSRMMGLSHGDPNQSYDEIDYAIYPSSTGILYVYEGGQSKGQFGSYASGDKLRVSVEGGQVKYRKNGALLYTSTPPAQYPLSADTSFFHPSATITDATIAATATTDISWVVADHLGTPRMVLDQTGSLAGVRRHDYLPFGEELSVGGRTTEQGYSGDSLRQKFTSHERDNETGLDYAGARHHGSIQGRFVSPDPLLSSGDVFDPQSWNRYSYVLNNPLALTDPLGLYTFDSSVDETQRQQFRDALTQAQANLKKIEQKYGINSQQYKKAARAIDIYGAEGVKNGVTVARQNGVGAGRVKTDGVAGRKTAANPTGRNIKVEFSTDTFKSSAFFSTVGHEGSHAADGADWVASGFKESNRPYAYQSEVDAYTVQAFLIEAEAPGNMSPNTYLPYAPPLRRGLAPDVVEPIYLYSAAWAEADKATLMRSNIDSLLARPQNRRGLYGLTPSSQRKLWRRGARYQ